MDILLIILLLLAALLGWYMGLIQQVASLAGFGVSLVVAYALCGTLAPLAQRLFATGDVASKGIAFVCVALVGTILLSWVAALVTHVIDTLHLGFINRGLGVVISVAKYAVVIGFVLKGLLFVGALTDDDIRQSLLARPLTRAADTVLQIVK